jgi:hypothetical protein
MGTSSQRFNLEAAVERDTSQFAGMRFYGYFIVAIGFVLVALSGLTALGHTGFTGSQALSLAFLFAIMGLILAAAGFGLARGSRGLPTSLEISQEAFILGWPKDNRQMTFSWDAPEFEVTVFDRRGMPRLQPNGKPRTTFTLLLPSGKRVPIPLDAFESILREAEAHHLKQIRKTIRATTDSGTYDHIRLVAQGT